MKYIAPFFLIFLFISSCSKSDSNESETENQPLSSLPIITTTAASEIAISSAISGGNVTSDGGGTVTARGVCWNTVTAPTIADDKTTNATGIGEFSSAIEGLEANTTYYLRSYAINSEGTAYGNEISFKTLEPEPISKIFEGDVILTTQQEVDDFGMQEYTEITGALKIRDVNVPSTIKNLKPLNTLVTIGDTLVIQNNHALVDLEGFSALKRIEGDLKIIKNDVLEKVNGFEEILSIGGELLIFSENSIFSLTGFEKITVVESNMIFGSFFPGRISNISGFDNLESVNGLLSLGGVTGEINAFEKLSFIKGSLYLQGLKAISNFKFLSALEGVDGQVRVSENSALESFEGLENLTELNGLYVLLNRELRSFKGLENVTKVKGGVTITINEGLTNLDGFQNLTKITNGGLDVSQNRNLISLSGLDNLKSVAGELEIWRNDSLETLTGLEGLEITGSGEDCLFCQGTIRIEGNQNLLDIDALANITTAWYGNVKVEYNEKLTNLDGFRNLVNIYKSPQDTRIYGASIENNPSLNDVCGLKKVRENNGSGFYIDGFFNGTVNPEGDARAMLQTCD